MHPLRLNPPNEKNSLHMMSPPFVVRPLPGAGLDGAFRVHLSPESLDHLGLKVGELCQITGENGGIGYGIAWRATDKMGNSPKLRPAKMTDTLRSAFGFKEGSHITISKSTTQVLHADSVTLTDVTPSDYGNAADLENGRWQTSCAHLLVYAEAVAAGTTFDVSAKKGLRKRFYVEHVESAGTHASGLFFCDDQTEFSLSGGLPGHDSTSLPNGDAFPVLDTSRIGGLVDQVKELNMRLDRLLDKSGRFERPANRHVLIHGYEGTGKTLILNRLAKTSACRVFRLGSVQMTTAAGKALSTIESTFKDAIACQPSVILMDDLEELSENEIYARVIGRELESLLGLDVLVVGATRSPTNIKSSLTNPGRLSKRIELPIPDAAARKEILSVLLGEPLDSDNAVSTAISMKTHGFTGRDLALLVEEATDSAYTRGGAERDGWVDVHARISMLHGAQSSQTDGSVFSQATTEVEQTQRLEQAAAGEHEQTVITIDDFELALTTVRPTALREIFLETPKVHWSDIGGSEGNKRRFDEMIGWPLHHPEIVERFHIHPQKGVLLYGPPGCSKTMTAQAVATTYDLNFIAVKGAELISMYVGESERAVREVFRKARQAAPCIVFFDEIDAIGSERESGGTKGLNVLTTLLNEMDGFEAMKDVLVLAATNKPEVLDPALLRPGRFDEHVYIGLPTAGARADILKMSLKEVPTGEDLDIMGKCVGATEGYSGAEIVAITQEMKWCAARRMMSSSGGLAISEGSLRAEDFVAAVGLVRKGVTEGMLKVYEDFANAS